MINLDELERLAKAATPGPWCDRGFGGIQPESGGSLVAVTVTKGGCLPDYVENSAYIAAVNPTAILELVAEVRRLREDADRYRWLRGRDLDTIGMGGLFVGLVPDNLVINDIDLDQAIDAALAKEKL